MAGYAVCNGFFGRTVSEARRNLRQHVVQLLTRYSGNDASGSAKIGQMDVYDKIEKN